MTALEEVRPIRITEYGLIIGGKWVDLILSGEKVWELRKGEPNKNVLGKDFGLIPKGTKTVAGIVSLVNCLGPLSLDELMKNRSRAQETEEEIIKDVKDGYTYAWALENPRRFEKPIPYNHPSGAVTWVILTNRMSSAFGLTAPQL